MDRILYKEKVLSSSLKLIQRNFKISEKEDFVVYEIFKDNILENRVTLKRFYKVLNLFEEVYKLPFYNGKTDINFALEEFSYLKNSNKFNKVDFIVFHSKDNDKNIDLFFKEIKKIEILDSYEKNEFKSFHFILISKYFKYKHNYEDFSYYSSFIEMP